MELSTQFVRNIHEQILRINGRSFSASDCLAGLVSLNDPGAASTLQEVLCNWFSSSDHFELMTSGSTGKPKRISVLKEQMMQSAMATCSYFNLKAGDRALLALPLQFVSGVMMLVRALVAGLELTIVPPSARPLQSLDQVAPFRFIPLTPMQLSLSLESEEERSVISKSEIILLGGSSITPDLEEKVRGLAPSIYSGYGMTETLSHIALRRLNGDRPSKFYTPMPGVKISLSEQQTLIVDAPHLSDTAVITNDIATLMPDMSFSIVGRSDNVVNSGGLKIQLEEVEEHLSGLIKRPFALSAVADQRLGEKLVLLLQQTDEPIDFAILIEELKAIADTKLLPKECFMVESIPQTANQKTDRQACRTLVEKLHKLQLQSNKLG